MEDQELIEALDTETFKIVFYVLGIKGGFYHPLGGVTENFTQAKLFKSVAEARAWQKLYDPQQKIDESVLLEASAEVGEI